MTIEEERLEAEKKEKLIKQLNQIICICNGIKLAAVLKGLPGSKTVEDVNAKVGTGCGDCKGERCGPRIRALLKKRASSQETTSK